MVCCCKIVAVTKYVQKKLGLFMGSWFIIGLFGGSIHLPSQLTES